MYLSDTRAADRARSEAPVPRRDRLRTAVPGAVLALGVTSLVTDVSAEMLTAVLPVYLVTGLGLSMLQFGFLDGLYSGATALLRVVGGYLADRFTARKLVAAFGYGMSALTKLGFPLVGASVPGIGLLLAADRAGKGIRTAPRDALISLSTPPERQGRAFGLHRAMDTVGAFIGPVVAFALMTLLSTDRGTAYDAVFVVSFCVAVVGVAALLLLVRDPFRATRSRPEGVSLRAGLRLTLRPELGRPSLAALLLGLATVSDSFVYLSLQQRTDLAVGWFPLLPLGTTGVFLLSAVPLGALADRIGRRRILIGGHLLLAAAYLLLTGALPLGGVALIVTVLALHGLFYGATDGVLMAYAGPLLPARLRTSGLSVLQTCQAFGRSASSIAFGAAWAAWGPLAAVRGFLAALLVAVLAAALLLRGRSETPEPGPAEIEAAAG